MLSERSVDAQWMLCVRSVGAQWTLSGRSVGAQWALSGRSVDSWLRQINELLSVETYLQRFFRDDERLAAACKEVLCFESETEQPTMFSNMLSERSGDAQWMPCVRSVGAQWTLSGRSRDAQWTLNGHSMDAR